MALSHRENAAGPDGAKDLQRPAPMDAQGLERPAGAGRVHRAQEGDIAFVTLDHPGRLNAISVEMWREIARIFTRLAEQREVRCVVLRGEGGNFAAGADISEFPRERADTAGVLRYHNAISAPALHAVGACPLPVVAQIEGVCVGGGLELASQCDIRIAGESSRFGVPINRLGFPMAPQEMLGLLALAGRAATLEILLEGRVFGSAEAREKGLLNRIVPDALVAQEALRAAQRIARGAPQAARLNKHAVTRLGPAPQPLSEAELASYFSYAESQDHREGVQAFLAGREPNFTGD
jgi:enoyl-CoA hydratase/carnithine racemase